MEQGTLSMSFDDASLDQQPDGASPPEVFGQFVETALSLEGVHAF